MMPTSYAAVASNLPGSATVPTAGVAINESSNSTGTGVAIGQDTTAVNSAVALGVGADAQQLSVSIGELAGSGNANTQGSNINIGHWAGRDASGHDNVAMGYNSGIGTASDDNVAIGLYAGQNVKTSNNNPMGSITGNNVSLGSNAGTNVTGDMNTGVGWKAGLSTTGNLNVGLGALAGYQVTGNNNIAIGTWAGSTITADNSISLGNSAVASANNAISIGKSSKAQATNAISIGSTISNTIADSILLGSNSTIDTPISTSSYTILGTTYDFAGGTANSVVSIGSSSGYYRTLTNLAAGQISATSTDAINGSQLYATNQAVETLATAVGKWNLSTNQDTPTTAVTSGATVDFSTTDNNVVIKNNGTNVTVDLAKNINVTSVTAADSVGNSTTVSSSGVTVNSSSNSNLVRLTNAGLDNGGNKITNVAAGTDDTDAVNYGQLRGLNNDIDYLTGEVRDVGAMSAALTALKPIQYDPLEPTQIMAGIGVYRSSGALALGMAHYKNESLMFHAGVAYAGGGSHIMANVGATWKFGKKSEKANIPERYRGGPISSVYVMQDEMTALKSENTGLKTEVTTLTAQNQAQQTEMDRMKAEMAAIKARLGM